MGKREVACLRHSLQFTVSQLEQLAGQFPQEDHLFQLGILERGEMLCTIRRIMERGSSESYLYAYELSVLMPDGRTDNRLLREKHVISPGASSERAAIEFERLKHLASLGIPTLRPYGVVNAAMYPRPLS